MKLGVYMLWTEMRGTDVAASVSALPAAELRATPLRAAMAVREIAPPPTVSSAVPKKAAPKRARKRAGLVEATR